MFESLIKARIAEHLASQPDGLSERQFRFVKGRSTTKSIQHVMEIVEHVGSDKVYRKLCALVSFDVANAFNTVPWGKIDAALNEKRVPTYLIAILRSYFDRRMILTED